MSALDQKWAAFRLAGDQVDGRDIAVTEHRRPADDTRDQPALIIAKPSMGKGLVHGRPTRWHLGWLDPEDAAAAVDEIKAQVI